jgi:TM2 domain-containing membrane protein YozV
MTMAIEKFSQLTKNPIKEETTVKAFYALGVLYAEIGKPKEAKENFKKLGGNSAYIDLSKKLTEEVDQYRAAKKKNPAAAGILAIIPGLGHLYCERPRDALVSFLVNGAFIWGTVESFRQEQYVLGGILAFFELGWYMGNIYSAVGSAYKHNRYQEKMFLEKMERNIDLTTPSSPSSTALILSFDIPF